MESQRKRIEHILDHTAVEAWAQVFADLSFNRYEAQALRGFLEEVGHLIDRRDDVDELRADVSTNPETGFLQPSDKQKRDLYGRTKVYFDTYYGALSHLSSVVARFSKVFGGAAHMDNGPFLAWLERYCASLGAELNVSDLTFKGLESARLFRAVLNHPQQFPPPDWSTEVRKGTPDFAYDVIHIVVHGPESRAGKIPPGSTRQMLPALLDADWRMDAPDEVHITNCFGNVSVLVLSAIYVQRSPEAAFVSNETLWKAAVEKLMVGGRSIAPGANVAAPQIGEQE